MTLLPFPEWRDPDDWRHAAACVGQSADLFFPGRGDVDAVQAARDLCSRCPVVEPCLEYALELMPRPDGIWGGTSTRQRRALRRERGISRPRPGATGPSDSSPTP